jgi:hypothetical protein
MEKIMKNSNSKKLSASTFTAWMMTIAFIALTAVSSLPALAQKKGVNWNHDQNIGQAVIDAFSAYQAGGISEVQTTVHNCYQNLNRSANNPSAGKDMQYCVSLDLTGFQIDRGFANAAKTPQQLYFLQNAVSDRTHKTLAGSASPDVIEGLLKSWYKTTGDKLSIKLR